MTALLLALLLALVPAQALAGKKEAGVKQSGNIAFYEEFIVVDGTGPINGKVTSFCKRNNTHLVIADSEGNIARCYIPAGFKLLITMMSYTLLESHETDDCDIRLAKNGVPLARSRASTGTDGDPHVCQHAVDPAADNLLIADKDACTRVMVDGSPIATFNPEDYPTVVWTTVVGGTCDDIFSTHVAMSGLVVPPL